MSLLARGNFQTQFAQVNVVLSYGAVCRGGGKQILKISYDTPTVSAFAAGRHPASLPVEWHPQLVAAPYSVDQPSNIASPQQSHCRTRPLNIPARNVPRCLLSVLLFRAQPSRLLLDPRGLKTLQRSLTCLGDLQQGFPSSVSGTQPPLLSHQRCLSQRAGPTVQWCSCMGWEMPAVTQECKVWPSP